ncbi:MAG: helix-turn-helix transcriptional regulator [Gammaproteobacteria bacterium]|nr:helix-turn-helix transcriptional regulator [Caldilineaceae bacterium]MCB1925834.1 helix-turn-helix transcriptional regulator [Gammaproteobacteria bacterium]
MNIGHALKICRSAKNLSLESVATGAGFSRSYLSMIESGRREPTLSAMEKIAAALNVPLPIILFIAADSEEIEGLDSETIQRLSSAALAVMRA